jgi:hypothetical protein
MPGVVRRPVSIAHSTSRFASATVAADHPYRGIFHPLGAAFLSNASYPETLKVLNQTDVSLEPFALAGAREMFRYNYTSIPRLHRSSLHLYRQKFHDMSSCGTSGSAILVRQTTRYDSCDTLRKTGPLIWE